MYYGVVTVAVIMFGAQFLFNSKYERECGNGIGATFLFSFIGGGIGVISLMIINGISISATPFTLIIASLSALNSILYTFCSLKAFERINLSLYSLFAMLGGMMLPFIQGIVFYDEPITIAKAVCVIFVIAALSLCTVKSDRKGGTIYYIGVFVLNGMSGVMAKIFQSSHLPKTSNAMYSVWGALIHVMISGSVLLIMLIASKASKKDKNKVILKKPSGKAVLFASSCGILNNLANFLLLIALAVLPSSVQYPFVTGGVMIVSTVFSFFTGSRPSKKEILSVCLSFIGIMALVLIPM